MLLHKTLSLNDVELKMDQGTGKFAGYASVFGGVDSYGDTIMPGAFAESLGKGMPKMFWNHEWGMPIGKWLTAKEDAKGLFVEGELTPGLGMAEDVKAALKHGTLDGLSIGGFLKRGDFTETDAGRQIHKWSSLVEVSPVTFPADSNARISSVKADMKQHIEQIDSIQEFESFLRDAAGLSKGAALALVARAKVVLGVSDSPAGSAEAKALAVIAERVKRMPVITA